MVYFICIKNPTLNKWFNLVGPLESSDMANSLVNQTRIEAHKIDLQHSGWTSQSLVTQVVTPITSVH